MKEEFKIKLKKTVIYPIYLKLKYLIYPIKLKKGGVNKKRPDKISVDANSEIIVSLTSFPGRIKMVHKTIYSIMNQSLKPKKIILWLSKKQFNNLDDDLPIEIKELEKFGLTIKWTDDDIKSYKKLIPALQEYSDYIIVTADDDIYYTTNWLKELYESYLQYPKDIHCHIITRLKESNGKIITVPKEETMIGKASYYNKLVGNGGVLYPRNSLHKNVLNIKEFQELAPTSDDIWFWTMAVLNGTKIRWIEKKMKKLYYTEYSQEKTDCLCKINDCGEKLFFKHMDCLVEKYNLLEILKKD